ncbi:hypothetical protein CR513_45168, partial [Mucuna pruriens]
MPKKGLPPKKDTCGKPKKEKYIYIYIYIYAQEKYSKLCKFNRDKTIKLHYELWKKVIEHKLREEPGIVENQFRFMPERSTTKILTLNLRFKDRLEIKGYSLDGLSSNTTVHELQFWQETRGI